jgi:flagellar basal body-associated protein FliL
MKLFKIISLVFAALMVGWLATRWSGGFKLSVPTNAQGSPPAESTGLGEVGPVVAFKPFVVSEWEGDEQHISSVTFEMEVGDLPGRDALKARTPEIRMAILAMLADTKLTNIGDPEDFAALKAKVKDRVQSLLPNHPIRRVLITDFLSK